MTGSMIVELSHDVAVPAMPVPYGGCSSSMLRSHGPGHGQPPEAPLVRGNFPKAPSLNFSAVENFPRSLRLGPLDTYRRGVETSLHAQPVQRR